MVASRIVAVVGARALPDTWAEQVGALVRHFLGRGWGIGSGGAQGADAFALRAVVTAGPAACARSVVFLPGRLHQCPDPMLGAAAGVVAVLWGPARGSIYTLGEAIRAGKPTAIVMAGGGAGLPPFGGGRWVPCRLGPVAASKWVAAPTGPPSDAEVGRPRLRASSGCQTGNRSTRCSRTSQAWRPASGSGSSTRCSSRTRSSPHTSVSMTGSRPPSPSIA